MQLEIRPATAQDAHAGVETLRRSIAELCRDDHHDDPAQLRPWLRNKTAANWALWLDRPAAFLLVAEAAGRVCGVGMGGDDGRILLNYVHPDFRFRGVSSAMLDALEGIAASRGARHASLESTRTARRFYLSRGYVCVGSEGGIHMRKALD